MTTTAPALHDALAARRGAFLGNRIGGEWKPAAAGATFERRNPADERELVGSFPLSGADDVAAAVAAAKQAFPAWRQLGSVARGKILLQASLVLTRRTEELAQAMSWEEGKALGEARQEVQRAIGYLEFLAGEGRRYAGEMLPSESGGLNYTRRRPLGVVGLITPWNFPVNIPVIKAGPALLTGNAVVLKPSELSPLCAAILAEVFEEAGCPPGVFNVVFGAEAAGEALVAHPDVRAISFTGSTAVGRLINQRASARFARVQLEMGGKNPAIVLADADLDKAAADIAVGGWSVTGQRCNANSLVFVAREVHEALAQRLQAKAAAIAVGPGLDPANAMGPLVERSARERVMGYVERAKADGAQVLAGGETPAEGDLAHGYYMRPTLLAGLPADHAVNCEELFGPVVTLVPIADLAEGVALANRLPYGLASSVYTRDVAAALSYAETMDAGILHVNCPTTLSELQMPYGGVKDSGHGGREMGRYVLDFYTELQAVYLRP